MNEKVFMQRFVPDRTTKITITTTTDDREQQQY